MRQRRLARHRLAGSVRATLVVATWLPLAWSATPLRAEPAAGTLVGVVLDASGAPIPGATVRVEVAGRAIEFETGADGRFVVDQVTGEVTVIAAAPGFASATVRVATADGGLVQIVLQPAPLTESITVTASRGTTHLETAGATSVLTSADLLTAAAPTIDDALRATPGFSLFRRSSSRVANPTTQGVTLRGVSGSGASRTLVLADGLPLNDPFGSWVYWNRVPQAAIDRVEVVRGATGDLYGPDALGGVIQILTFAPQRPRVRAFLDGGSHATGRGSLFAGGRIRRWTMAAAGEWVRTDGVVIVARDERGPVDVPADSDYRTAFLTVGYEGPTWRASLRGSVFDEDRSNGTPLQVNSTAWRQLAGELTGTAAGAAWLARVAVGSQDYHQTFSAVAADRRSERLTSEQFTPTRFTRASAQWVRPLGAHALIVGADGQRIESTGEEVRFAPTGARLGPFPFGGTETSGAIFGRASLAAAERVTVVAGLRGDFWRSTPATPDLPRHAVGFLSPRASVAVEAGRGLTLRAAAYRAYRTPTLNELHRGFRVGNVVTNPNPLLEPERLTGLDGGLLFAAPRLSTRVTAFWNVLDDAIANITQLVTPSQITRQRQNADQIRAAGVEFEADLRPLRHLTLNALAVFTSSIFRHTPKQPAIEGHRVPQVPRLQLGAGASYTDPRVATLAAQLRVVGLQYDDDLNQFPLDRFVVMDLYVGRAMARRLQVFFAIENLFDTEYDVGRTPVRTVGWPRTVRGGVRMFLP
jgi:outer membrane receptor protein involved in Fe transport